jgi:hypothetical protein
LHSSVPPASAGVNVKLADVEFVGSAGLVLIVGSSGGVVSTVTVPDCCVASLPAASSASIS